MEKKKCACAYIGQYWSKIVIRLQYLKLEDREDKERKGTDIVATVKILYGVYEGKVFNTNIKSSW